MSAGDDDATRIFLLSYAAALANYDASAITALLKEELRISETETIKIDLNDRFMPALHVAISNYAPVSFLRHLINLGADVNGRDYSGDTPLHTIATRNDQNGAQPAQETILLLLAQGAKIDARDNYGNSPLGFAATSDHMPVVRLLLENGADINNQNDTGYTAAMAALYHAGKNSRPVKSFAMARFLIEHPESDLLCTMRDGQTIHDIALKKDDMPQDLLNTLEDRIAQQRVDLGRRQQLARMREINARNLERLDQIIKKPKRPNAP